MIINDEMLLCYQELKAKSLHAVCDHLNNDLKARRAEMRGVAKSLEVAYPNSSSIKHGFTIALMPAKVKESE